MPLPITSFTQTATVLAYSEDEVTIVIPCCGTYQFSLQVFPVGTIRQLFQWGHGWLTAQDYLSNLENFVHLLRHIPTVIPAGQILPLWFFMRSPFTESAYYTFPCEFYLKRVDYTPLVHVDTRIEFPATLVLEIVWDVRLVYQRSRIRERPALPPSGYERHYWGNERFPLNADPNKCWAWDIQGEATFTKGVQIAAYQVNHQGNHDRYWVFCDCLWLWNGIDIPDDVIPYSPFYARVGLRCTSEGRYYFSGDSEDETGYFPFRRLYPFPADSIRCEVINTATYNTGNLRGYGSSLGGVATIYPPNTRTPDVVAPLPPIAEIYVQSSHLSQALPLIRWLYQRRVALSYVVGGNDMRIGQGGGRVQ